MIPDCIAEYGDGSPQTGGSPRRESQRDEGTAAPVSRFARIVPVQESGTLSLPRDAGAAEDGRSESERHEKRPRRVLLVTAGPRLRKDLAGALAQEGHEVLHATIRGRMIVSAIECTNPLHVVVVSQALLGNRWPALVRQLRRRAPRTPVILLLRAGAEWAWRCAFTAGAFDALPAYADAETVLSTVDRALCAAAPDATPASQRQSAPGSVRARSTMGGSGSGDPGGPRQ